MSCHKKVLSRFCFMCVCVYIYIRISFDQYSFRYVLIEFNIYMDFKLNIISAILFLNNFYNDIVDKFCLRNHYCLRLLKCFLIMYGVRLCGYLFFLWFTRVACIFYYDTMTSLRLINHKSQTVLWSLYQFILNEISIQTPRNI